MFLARQRAEGSDVVDIVVESEEAKLAAEDANAFAETYIEVRRDLAVNDLTEASDEVLARIAELDPQIASYDADLAANPPLPVTSPSQRQDPRLTLRARLQSQRDGYANQYERLQEAATIAQTGGARVLAVPSAFTDRTGKDHWEVLLRARAIENIAYVVAAAQWGAHGPGRASHGHALIVDPWGSVLAQVPDGEGVAVAELDFDRQDRLRRELPALSHIRLPIG